MAISPITCHVLDTSTGRPVQGIAIKLQQLSIFHPLAEGETNSDGRCTDLLSPASTKELLKPGIYKMIFRTKEYFDSQSPAVKSFYPWVEISFELFRASEHYHIPLLISPYGFTTYRGS
ncbi:Hydroxyisourate hydrolase [Gymnopus androsaceus JB14]|uniref:5-hydroxyisourate hydrolase n=1 Tax=Gymnopus androsaceus JB14 TaxID=1447944 RepID=A0A6A4HKA4_9AGAR|nr:Hydroxyisourate hydrolase [Gymnopus androsaceus JB14]